MSIIKQGLKYIKIVMRSALSSMPTKKVVKAEKVRNVRIDYIFLLWINLQKEIYYSLIKRIPNLKAAHILMDLRTVLHGLFL